MTCPLCELAHLTHRHYEDDLVVVLDCVTCNVPMGVLRRHSMEPTSEETQRLIGKLKELFPGRRLDKNQRKIPEHLHWHMR